MATSDVGAFTARAEHAGVAVVVLGLAGGASLAIGSTIDLSVGEIATRRSGALEEALASLD
jgi:hypothetical protein